MSGRSPYTTEEHIKQMELDDLRKQAALVGPMVEATNQAISDLLLVSDEGCLPLVERMVDAIINDLRATLAQLPSESEV